VRDVVWCDDVDVDVAVAAAVRGDLFADDACRAWNASRLSMSSTDSSSNPLVSMARVRLRHRRRAVRNVHTSRTIPAGQQGRETTYHQQQHHNHMHAHMSSAATTGGCSCSITIYRCASIDRHGWSHAQLHHKQDACLCHSRSSRVHDITESSL
jgi:hypothetical protein